MSGDGSGVHCSAPGFDSDGGVIIADVDGDGRNEVVGDTSGYQVRALDGDCNVEWTSNAFSLLYPVPTAADLNADGTPEVVFDAAVVNGRTGATVATLVPNNGSCWRAPFTGDFDQDGDVEIMLANTVFDGQGNALWSAPGSGTSCFGGAINLDADPQAEIFLSYGTVLGAYEHDGTLIWSRNLAVANPGPPCAGDIDGDGEAEIIAPNGTQLTAFEADGSFKWTAPMQDSSGAAGCSVFDMNGDQVYEVLFADETALRLYDGATGTVLWQNTTHDSVTYFETPTVADVDNDGSAEMLVANSGALSGLTVFGHNGSGWPASGPTWGLHDFSATNQLPDGTIPATPVAPWLQYNIFRGRPFDDEAGAPNLVGEVTDVCVSSCLPRVGVVTLAVQVANDGGSDARETLASLYLVNPANGNEFLYDTITVPAAVAGEVETAVTFEVSVADWTGEYLVRLDDDGTHGSLGECDEGDNEIRGSADVCP
ncbi:MAG: PQQ-binding-like beta-propeller repeat protein [Myxococcota bacterium]